MTYLISMILFIIIVCIIIKRISYNNIIDISFWIIIFYSFFLIVHFTFGVEYKSGNALRALPYFLLGTFAVLLGIKKGEKITKRKRIILHVFNAKKILYLTFVFSIILMYDIYKNNTILLIGSRIEDFQISTIGTIANIIASFGLIPWLGYIYNFITKNKKFPLYSFLGLFAFIAYDLITGGRQTIFISLLSTSVMFIYSYKKKKYIHPNFKLNIPYSVYGIFIIIFLFLFTVSSNRTKITSIDFKIEYLENFFSADIDNNTEKLIRELGPFGDIYTEFGLYYSHELNRLDILLENYDKFPTCFPSEMGYFVRRIPGLEDIINEYWIYQEKLFEGRNNFSVHTWGTFLTNYIINYGKIGAILACFITGLIIGRFQKKFYDSQSLSYLIRQCILVSSVFISLEFSPLYLLSLFSTILFSTFFDIKYYE